MNRNTLLVIPFCFLLLMAACQTDKPVVSPPANSNATAGPSSTPDPFAATRVSYDANCRLCHGAKGEGGPVKLEDGTKLKVPSLREGHALRDPDSDFVKQITKGGDGMPAFGEKLKPEEINELVRFIRREFQAGQASPAK
jgi:mono/diheme cytochrome c family protein